MAGERLHEVDLDCVVVPDRAILACVLRILVLIQFAAEVTSMNSSVHQEQHVTGNLTNLQRSTKREIKYPKLG